MFTFCFYILPIILTIFFSVFYSKFIVKNNDFFIPRIARWLSVILSFIPMVGLIAAVIWSFVFCDKRTKFKENKLTKFFIEN